jgi:hypothetical protein
MRACIFGKIEFIFSSVSAIQSNRGTPLMEAPIDFAKPGGIAAKHLTLKKLRGHGLFSKFQQRA